MLARLCSDVAANLSDDAVPSTDGANSLDDCVVSNDETNDDDAGSGSNGAHSTDTTGAEYRSAWSSVSSNSMLSNWLGDISLKRLSAVS